MRSVIRSMRALLCDFDSYEAGSGLVWTSALAENGMLKIEKIADFQCHRTFARRACEPRPRKGVGDV